MSEPHRISGCDNEARLADVLFVHGLGGDAFETWRHGEDASTSWPHWLGAEFPQVGVWSLGYAASPLKGSRWRGWFSKKQRDAGYALALPDRALQVLDLLVQRGFGRRPLFFIGHSLGGLVIKQILRTAMEAVEEPKRRVAEQTRAVLFLATPHAGADLASLLDRFRSVFGTTVSIEDLRSHNAHLRNLYNWYRNHSDRLGITTATYYETRGVARVLPIVDSTSSQAGVGRDAVPLDEDHLSIAKPRSDQAQVFAAARNLLRDSVLVPREAFPTSPDGSAPLGERRISHELPPAAERYFGRQKELQQLTERLRAGKNTAVVGPAGFGKTALAAEAVRAVVGESAESLAGSRYLDGVVFLDLYTFHGQSEAAWNNLANKLDGAAFLERAPARDRAVEACRARRILVIVEGGEEADGEEGRTTVGDLFGVLSPENRWLLLTRRSDQAAVAESVVLGEALPPTDAGALLDSLTDTDSEAGGLPAEVRQKVLDLLDGHPLALTWAGNLLGLDEDDPASLVADWQAHGLRDLRDPTEARHTLEWLFKRSVRGLSEPARQALEAAGLLAHAPFPLAAVAAALGDAEPVSEEAAREALKSLIRRGLLRRSEEAGHWQFTHVLGYQFARQDTGSDIALRTRLARWLNGYFKAAMKLEAIVSGLGDTNPLDHVAALLDQSLLLAQATDLSSSHAQLMELRGLVQLNKGDLPSALLAFQKAVATRQRLLLSDPPNTQWQEDLSFDLSLMAEVYEQQEDRVAALSCAEESLEIIERLAALDPTNATWQKDLAASRALMARLKK